MRLLGAQITKSTSRYWQISVTRYMNRWRAEGYWQKHGWVTKITDTFSLSFRMLCAFPIALARLVAAFLTVVRCAGVSCRSSIFAICAIIPSQAKWSKTLLITTLRGGGGSLKVPVISGPYMVTRTSAISGIRDSGEVTTITSASTSMGIFFRNVKSIS